MTPGQQRAHDALKTLRGKLDTYADDDVCMFIVSDDWTLFDPQTPECFEAIGASLQAQQWPREPYEIDLFSAAIGFVVAMSLAVVFGGPIWSRLRR